MCNVVSYTLQPEQLVMRRRIDKDTFEQNGSHSYAPQVEPAVGSALTVLNDTTCCLFEGGEYEAVIGPDRWVYWACSWWFDLPGCGAKTGEKIHPGISHSPDFSSS